MKEQRELNCPWPKYWPITFFAICDHIKITCSKSDLRSDQDHDLEFSQKVIGDKIAILDHFLSQSLWIFLPQFSEHRFRFNIVVSLFTYASPVYLSLLETAQCQADGQLSAVDLTFVQPDFSLFNKYFLRWTWKLTFSTSFTCSLIPSTSNLV